MSLMGICGAALGAETPLLIPALFVPAVLIHRAVSQSVRLRENMFESLAAMVEIVELRDPYTAGHSRRVAETARLIALHLGMTDEEADVVESAGRVHDIGKVAIDPAILTKASVLTDVEWTEMRLHPVLGAEVIGKFESYRSGVALVRSHHEAWDGSGYPDQLRGDAIPMGARILAVADTFDALTSDRPYREGKPVRDAIAILNNPNQQQWDPTVVRALIDLLGDDHTIVPVDQPVERLAAQPFLATAS
jgi:HD-GYP domain-containing protein (c-di-GMP phosphodiesterase class II)